MRLATPHTKSLKSPSNCASWARTGSWYNSVSPADYLSLYNSEVFSSPSRSWPTLWSWPGVLVCYESPKDIQAGKKWCHRHIAAVRLEDTLGIEVPELGHRDLDRFHLLRKV